jgi:hypothetical protein
MDSEVDELIFSYAFLIHEKLRNASQESSTSEKSQTNNLSRRLDNSPLNSGVYEPPPVQTVPEIAPRVLFNVMTQPARSPGP